MGHLDRLCFLQHSKLGSFHFTESVIEYKLTWLCCVLVVLVF